MPVIITKIKQQQTLLKLSTIHKLKLFLIHWIYQNMKRTWQIYKYEGHQLYNESSLITEKDINWVHEIFTR